MFFSIGATNKKFNIANDNGLLVLVLAADLDVVVLV